MFIVNLEQNAATAYLAGLESLHKILDGEGSYQNYRNYILNLHNALELFFKKKLMDYNEFMIFDFKNFDKIISKYKKASDYGLSLFEYVEQYPVENGNKDTLPNTVTFIEAAKRLTYLYKAEGFSTEYIMKLEELNELRNNITHFSLTVRDDQFILLNELFIRCSDYYEEYCEWGYQLPIEIELVKRKNSDLRSIILNSKFNKELINILCEISRDLTDDYFDFDILAEFLIEQKYYSSNDKMKLVNRLKILENIGLFSHVLYEGENYDVGWIEINREYLEL